MAVFSRSYSSLRREGMQQKRVNRKEKTKQETGELPPPPGERCRKPPGAGRGLVKSWHPQKCPPPSTRDRHQPRLKRAKRLWKKCLHKIERGQHSTTFPNISTYLMELFGPLCAGTIFGKSKITRIFFKILLRLLSRSVYIYIYKTNPFKI